MLCCSLILSAFCKLSHNTFLICFLSKSSVFYRMLFLYYYFKVFCRVFFNVVVFSFVSKIIQLLFCRWYELYNRCHNNQFSWTLHAHVVFFLKLHFIDAALIFRSWFFFEYAFFNFFVICCTLWIYLIRSSLFDIFRFMRFFHMIYVSFKVFNSFSDDFFRDFMLTSLFKTFSIMSFMHCFFFLSLLEKLIKVSNFLNILFMTYFV